MLTPQNWRPEFPKAVTQGLQVVPNTTTILTTTDTMVFQIVVSNVSGGAATFRVRDKQGTPLILIPVISIATATHQIYDYPQGVLLKGGMDWESNTASALNAEVVATYK